ncbi:SKY1 [[Candida] subhashii]|uniref:non-specific serine/threonine protein kinase n=1 Tax=[Candida] subhashii TaxID=561895 RepID=A0A8J5UJF2_9ASCO|nr:SKY1 [[Candida] subhashii]KAG7661111.1 SKY1 [[Candida] subhashii]
MLLINRNKDNNTKVNTNATPFPTTCNATSPTMKKKGAITPLSAGPSSSPEHKKHKFKISGLFKKNRNYEGASSSSSSTTAIPTSTENIIDDINLDHHHLTIIPSIDEHQEQPQQQQLTSAQSVNTHRNSVASSIYSNHHNNHNQLHPLYQHNPSQYTTLVNDQERYTSFTSECISLQNSEMTATSNIEEDSIGESKPRPKKNLRSLLRLGSFSGNIESTNPHHPYSIEIVNESCHEDDDAEVPNQDDDLTCLSDSESDLNFDPKSEETQVDYKFGGYHPVSKGEVYYSQKFPNREYIILRKLGWGHFSTVWLAKSRFNFESIDSTSTTLADVDTREYYVAMKFVKSNRHYSEAAEDEIRIMKTLCDPIANADHLPNGYQYFDGKDPTQHPGYKHIMKLLDDFQIEGPHGNHICMVFEILGENILNLIYKYKKFYRSVHDVIKEKKEGSDEEVNAVNDGKFMKWDTKAIKKNTKSMLSLRLKTKSKSKSNSTDISSSSSLSSTIASPTEMMNIHTEDTYSTTSTAITSDSWLEESVSKHLRSLPRESLVSLMSKSQRCGGIPLLHVRQIMRQILLAMDYMHHCGVIHTDLKPENILLEIKDINKIIKSIEMEKLSKLRSSLRKTGSFKQTTTSSSSCSVGMRMSTSRNLSTTSNPSRSSSMCYYKRSKNSVCGTNDCPIRSSKPFGFGISSEVFFKDVNFQGGRGGSSSSRRRRSSTTSTSTRSSTSPASRRNSSRDSVDNNGEISIKIADLGNATFTDHHFTNSIQTRQYRSPEILLRYKSWGSSTDVWSIGCILFELITGDFLFDPHEGGKYFERDEDHLAQIVELIGEFPSDEYLVKCKNVTKYFKMNKRGEIGFRHIDKLKYWGLQDVLIEKYGFEADDVEVKLISDFILKCLKFDLNERYDCRSLLSHPWLKYNQDEVYDMDLEALESEMANLPNLHDDIPGYTCECKV